jgi:hypothetical protein
MSASSLLPDMDVFCNRGAKDIIPLWRDALASQANITVGVLGALGTCYSRPVSPEELFAYCVAVLGGPAYAKTFEAELATPGPRVPVTADKDIFREGVRLGAELVWLQTFGERWLSPEAKKMNALHGSARVAKPIPEDEDHYPSEFSYDTATSTLSVGGGCVTGISPQVYGYSVSGFKVVESWLRYRMKERGGRARSEATRSKLDEIRPRRWAYTEELLELLWVVEGCVLLWPRLEAFLGSVIGGPQIFAADLPVPTEEQREEPRVAEEVDEARLI